MKNSVINVYKLGKLSTKIVQTKQIKWNILMLSFESFEIV